MAGTQHVNGHLTDENVRPGLYLRPRDASRRSPVPGFLPPRSDQLYRAGASYPAAELQDSATEV